jgi:Dullard-like phosphatase family protein
MSFNINLPNKDSQSLRLSSSSLTSEKISPNEPKYDVNIKSLSIKQKINLELFDFEVSKLKFCPIGSSENISGNYDNYLYETLTHIAQMKNIKFNYALDSPSIYENYPYEIIEHLSLSNKKILILDLDETLIHADFDEEFANSQSIKYDNKISFYSEENCLDRNSLLKDDDNESTSDDDSKDYSNEKILNVVGIFLRPGVRQFLEEVSKNFDVGIFTASVPEYANAVINYLDPDNKFIKFRLYRNNCVNVGNLLKVKNLNIFKNIPIKKIIMLDNNIYSFSAQLNNGILINSFYNDKNDNELSNVLNYLNNYILPAEDVRKINEQFFGFKKIVDDINNIET